MSVERLLQLVGEANANQRKVAVIGAWARNAWAPPRATSDLDITVAADQQLLGELNTKLGEIGYVRMRSQTTDPDDDFPDILVYRNEQAVPAQIDILVAKTEFEREALRRAMTINITNTDIPVATPEDLIIYKLIADRPRDRDDIDVVIRSLRTTGTTIDWAYIDQWASFWKIKDRADRLKNE